MEAEEVTARSFTECEDLGMTEGCVHSRTGEHENLSPGDRQAQSHGADEEEKLVKGGGLYMNGLLEVKALWGDQLTYECFAPPQRLWQHEAPKNLNLTFPPSIVCLLGSPLEPRDSPPPIYRQLHLSPE